MNRIIYLIAFLLFSTFIISCSNEITEENKNDLERFEIEWTSHLELGEYFQRQLLEFESKMVSTTSDTLQDTLYVERKTLYQDVFIPKMKYLQKKYSAYLKKFKKVNRDWVEFKNRAMKDEMTSDEAESGLKDWEDLLETRKHDLKGMFYQLDALKVKSNE